MKGFVRNVGTIHFVGIGGIGMSGIASILVNLGYKVSGSDLHANSMVEGLMRKGVNITIGHHASNVHGASVVVISSAVMPNNVEVQEARRLKIPVVQRAEMLAELMKMKSAIAIAGSHGKTTVTSLVSSLLDQAGLDPTVINGGIINAYNNNARLGSGDWMVVEADESDGSFTRLHAQIAIVTNIDFDHVDNFKDSDELRNMFMTFIGNLSFYGLGILCNDNPEVARLISSIIDRRIITYGLHSPADISANNIVLSDKGAEFDVVFSEAIVEKYNVPSIWPKICLNMFGEHNVQNALSIVAVALELGISEEHVRVALESFRGVKRRFTKLVDWRGITVIDDYAHHPTEISAVIKAMRSLCKGKIIVVIQPHRYSRLRNFIDEFVTSLELSDYAFITPIYTAGEEPNGLDHFSLLNRLQDHNTTPAECVQDIDDLWEKIQPLLKENNSIIFMGAGDITNWAHRFSEYIKERL